MESSYVSYIYLFHLVKESETLFAFQSRKAIWLSEFQAPVESCAVGVFPNPQSLWLILYGLLSHKTQVSCGNQTTRTLTF